MKMTEFFPALLILLMPIAIFAEEEATMILGSTDNFADEEVVSEQVPSVECCAEQPVEPCCEPERKWYFEVKPGYYYLTDESMRKFFDTGGFTFRAEAGYKFWGPFIVWLDGSYFQKDGAAIGGDEHIEILLASITLGLKAIYYIHDRVAMYVGAGPRLFLMMLDNDSPFVRGEDNQFGIGGGFDAGFWFFPFPCWNNFWKNVFLDLFVDYSLKKMKIEEDEISSHDFDVDVSGFTTGLGLGIRF